MLDFRERSRLRRALYAKPTLILLAILATGVVHASWSMYQKSKEALVKKEKALSELSELEARQAQLSHDITVLSTERGVEAETLACGTGSVAAGVIASFVGHADSPVQVTPKSGETLTIHFERNGNKVTKVYLEGPAKIVFEGSLEV